MKLLIHGINYAPELTGVGRYTGEMAEWLATRDHEVRVVTAPPYYPQWRVQEGYRGGRYLREEQGGVTVWRCPLYVPARPTGLKRILHLASFALSSLPVMLRQVGWRPELVLVVAPTLLAGPVGWLTARLAGARSWLHVQDFEVDAAFGLVMLNGGLPALAALGFERSIMRRFDTVSTISPAMRKRLATKRVEEGRTFLFPNWADPRCRFDENGRRRFRARHGLGDDTALVVYSGNLGKKQGLEVVVDAARQLPEVFFLVCGEGAGKQELMDRVRGAALKNIRFLPLQPSEELPALLSAGDVHLVVQKRGAADLVMPSKLTNILAAGRACVVTADPGTTLHDVVAQERVGLAVPPEDPIALSGAVEKLFAAPDLRRELERNAAAYAKRALDRNTILTALEAKLMDLCGGGAS